MVHVSTLGGLRLVTRDEELWGAALAIQKLHGERAPLYVAEQLGAAAVLNDPEGVQLLTAIATRLDTLLQERSALVN